MKKNKETTGPVIIDPFTSWAHKTGRVFILLFMAYTFVIPIVMCTVYGCWPSFSQVLPGMVSILALMVPTCVAEVGSYVPILGSSTYLTFATGNVMNLKIPCALNAQKIAKVDQNTTEGDAIALISTCVSAIVTIIILAIGLVLVVPLQGVLKNEFVNTASNYILPALFGCMVLGFIGKGNAPTYVKNKLLIIVVPVILVAALTLCGIASTGMAGYLLLVMIPISILCARILWKKGIVQVVPNPNYKGTAPTEAEQ
jgi:hypothetical protein